MFNNLLVETDRIFLPTVESFARPQQTVHGAEIPGSTSPTTPFSPHPVATRQLTSGAAALQNHSRLE
jgi:hypothetical protein